MSDGGHGNGHGNGATSNNQASNGHGRNNQASNGHGRDDHARNGDANGNGNGHAPGHSLDLRRLFSGRVFVVVGGTGFLGKVFCALLLDRYPELRHVYLVVRPKAGLDASARYWKEIASSEVMRPLRERHGERFEAFLREKVTPVAGDVAELYCGLSASLREGLRGKVATVVNASGVVEFDPPLDVALEVNAFGVQNLVALARDLGDVPLFHTSTCFVAGSRTGFVEERNPLEHPFPRAGELERAHWDADREIAECLDVIKQARHRADDAFRQSHFVDEAKRRLRAAGAPTYGAVLDAEVAKVRRLYIEERLAEMGMERAQFWGWPNTYTYTKSLGEQIVASSGLPFTIGRPAIIESTVSFPFPGWNEGVNTSAPLIYALRAGQPQIPGAEHTLDLIPCDMVASAMLMSVAELLERTAPAVYQYGSSDTNPVTMARIFELSGLYKRQYYQRGGKAGSVTGFLQAHFEGALLSKDSFDRIGPHALARATGKLADVTGSSALGPARALLAPVAKRLGEFSKQQAKVGDVLKQFVPFTAEYDYTFRCDHTRAAYARLAADDRRRLIWAPESIDWRKWFLDVHVPALERWVFPIIDQRLQKKLRAPERHTTLVALLDDMAARFELAVGLQRAESGGFVRVSYREWQQAALAMAARLREQGVERGDRVAIAASNHPAWAVALFGIQYAGATAVPLDASVDAAACLTILRVSRAKVLLLDARSERRLGERVRGSVKVLDLQQSADLENVTSRHGAAPPATALADASALGLPKIAPEDVALLIYTSGTTAAPKGVMLSHYNLTSLVAALMPLFPLERSDRVLSVLPLHHTFELTCGLLLPLSRGASVIYLDQVNRERMSAALREARVTALVGVPALWESLERQIYANIEERGPIAGKLFEFALSVSRGLGQSFGVDAGKLLFGPVHRALGNNLRFLVSGGAALPASTHQLFTGLGLHLAEGYGLTEASPVVSVARGGPGARAGNVGQPVPGVQVRISEPDAGGVGEIMVKGPNVMLGYADDEGATRAVLDGAGWLATGDLGKLDSRGRLVIVGRQKEVIVPANGENVYPDDVEARLGSVPHVEELAVVGVTNEGGKESVALVAVASKPGDEGHARAERALDRALSELPSGMRPALVQLVDTPLPRTATRKVRRADVQRELQLKLAQSRPARSSHGEEGSLDAAALAARSAIAAVCRRDPASLSAEQSLRADLAFDSLMLLELVASLEAELGRPFDAERLAAGDSVADVERAVRDSKQWTAPSASTSGAAAGDERVPVPEVVRGAVMQGLGRAQQGFYANVMRTRVTGQAFVPHNRHTLVVANHTSHLDMGLVKYALGSYARDMVSLAAQDYFFESGKWRRAYFENFTNLVPLSRTGSLRQSLRQAAEQLELGKVVLLFPEGTRSPDGQLGSFKPLAAHLALQHGVDVLPLWLGGTHAALPRGASVIKSRELHVRIGPPLEIAELKRLTDGLPSVERTRAVTRLIRRAIEELSHGRHLDTRTLAPESLDSLRALPAPATSLEGVFSELERRFKRGSVKAPISYYFSLGSERWTVHVNQDTCRVQRGKAVDVADCVLKTTPAIFERIVRDAYSPSPGEFLSGSVKSNNIPLLMTFQQVFQLTPGDSA
jgi:long-chain acyl-CoA synthetase